MTLNTTDRFAIHTLNERGWTEREIARLFNVSRSGVWHALRTEGVAARLDHKGEVAVRKLARKGKKQSANQNFFGLLEEQV